MNDTLNLVLTDDDPKIQHYFDIIVKMAEVDVNVHICNNGQELLNYLNDTEKLPDYVFLDIYMPVMDGLSALKKIRQIERLKDIQFILFTNTSNISEMVKIIDTNVKFITKDYGADRFVKFIQSLSEHAHFTKMLHTKNTGKT